MAEIVLGSKRAETHDRFKHVADHIRQYLPPDDLAPYIETALIRLRDHTAGKRAAYAWSGGKDSQVVMALCEQLGIRRCVIGLAQPDLEYPVVERWIAAHQPDGLTVKRSFQDLPWLAAHPALLFNRGVPHLHEQWWRPLVWQAQQAYCREQDIAVMVFGRRRIDGNMTGKDGLHFLGGSDKQTLALNPIYDWPHEAVLAYNSYFSLPEIPYYGFANGYKIGTGPWGDRSDARDHPHGWALVSAVDPQIVAQAAPYFASARQFLEGQAS